MKSNLKQTPDFRKLGYELLSKEIFIPELSQSGVITSIFIGDSGVQYNVRYFLNGDAKTVYMYDHEITMKGDIG